MLLWLAVAVAVAVAADLAANTTTYHQQPISYDAATAVDAAILVLLLLLLWYCNGHKHSVWYVLLCGRGGGGDDLE